MSDSLDLDRFIRLPELTQIVGLSKPVIYRLIAAGEFPRSRKYRGADAVYWLQSEVVTWQRSQLEAA